MGRQANLAAGFDPVLTEIARGYSNSEYIWQNMFPVVKTPGETGKIPIWTKDAFVHYDVKRALRAKSNRIDAAWFTLEAYQTEEVDAEAPLDYREIKNAALQKIINLESIATKMSIDAIDIDKEITAATLLQDVNNYETANKIDLADDYLNEAAIDPIEFLRKQISKMHSILGRRPNVLWMGGIVWNILQTHAKIKSYLSVSSDLSAVATLPKLNELLEIPTIVVGNAKYSDTPSPTSLSNIWGNYIGLQYIAQPSGITRDMYDPAWGYTIQVEGNPFTDKYTEGGDKIYLVRSTDNYQMKIVGKDAGFLIKDPIDPAIYAAY